MSSGERLLANKLAPRADPARQFAENVISRQEIGGFRFIFQRNEGSKKSKAAKQGLVGKLTIIFLAKSTCGLPSNSFAQTKIGILREVVLDSRARIRVLAVHFPERISVQGAGRMLRGRSCPVAVRVSMADKISYSS